ncbi:MAG: hypothetical protein M0R77_18715 [Gammaproteobacteria bacterium]|nr:hypothetical protein [Gammaproteobacteria bacterium]
MDVENLQSAKNITTAVYALQALGFVFGITFVVAVVLNYIKREDVRGTWLESHFRWQIRTFWYGLLWSALGTLLAIILVGWFIWAAAVVWVIYRIAKGWLRLSEGKEMYV